jgi:hypothetical protein
MLGFCLKNSTEGCTRNAVNGYLPASVNEIVPENDLARFTVKIVERLDLSALIATYGDRGTLAYDPAMMLALLLYARAMRTSSSRDIEAATCISDKCSAYHIWHAIFQTNRGNCHHNS